MSDTYYFDTYALFEVIDGNPNYMQYVTKNIIITQYNLTELNYNLKKKMSKKKADMITQDYSSFQVNVTTDDVIVAMDLKTKHRHLSMPDAIGYTLAKKHGVKFLTGDEDFRHFENVEFVKK